MTVYLDGVRQFDATHIRTKKVAATAPTDGQVYAYNSATGLWEPSAASGGTSMFRNQPSSGKVWSTPGWMWSTKEDNALAEGNFIFIPMYIHRTFTFDRIGVRVTTLGAGLMRLGLYNYDDALDKPSTLIVDGGTVDVSATGGKEVVIDEELTEGFYFIAGVPDISVSLRGADMDTIATAPVSTGAVASLSVPISCVHLKTGQEALVAAGLPADAPEPTAMLTAKHLMVQVRRVL